jgi:predicted DNA-binding transcriptional regulator YafY
MAQTKLATIRYQALDRCFSNFGRRFYIEDLIAACNESLREYLGEDAGVKRRQVFDDINFMESDSGWAVPLERLKDGKRTYYRYADKNFSINRRPMSETEAHQLRDTIIMLQRFKGMPNYGWVEEIATHLQATYGLGLDTNMAVSFQNNPYLKGLEFFTPIFNAIVNKRALTIAYKPFGKPERTLEINPYFLKQYNDRWFLFGRTTGFTKLTNIALDRIISVEESNRTFSECPPEINFEEFFEDVVGVSVDQDAPTMDVLLRVNPQQASYIRNKPLHESQSEPENGFGDGYAYFRLQVKDNYELRSLLLSFGAEIEVLAPESFRREMAAIVSRMAEKYI